MFDIFAQWFTNPLSFVFMGLFVLIGILIGVFLRPWMGNKVIKFIPADHRFVELGIDEETAISIQCKKQKGMPLNRFFKHHPGFTGIVGRILKKPISLFLALEGTAYTWKLIEGKWLSIGGLADAVRSLWGEDFWATVPRRQKDLLDDSRISVTVGLDEAPITPEGRRSISEEDIKQEQDRKASETFWSEHRSVMKGMYVNMILAGGTGFGICALLVLLGILRIPTPDVAPVIPPAVNQTAQVIYHLIRSRM